MVRTLILFAVLLAQPETPAWYSSRNYPEWQGYGVPVGDHLTPERWRRKAEPSVEYILDGDPVPEGYTRIEEQPSGGDVFGFVSWLNSTRATYNLPPVSWHPDMASAAAANNSLQVAHGMGHHGLFGARRQNVAWASYPALLNMWLASPGHQAALLDPNLVHVGIAFAGAYCTFSGR